MKPAHKKKLIIGLIFVGVIILLRFAGIGKYISFKSIQENKPALQAMIDQNYWSFVAGFLGLYILLTLFSLPFSVILNVIGGFFFGTLLGALYSIIGATTGATISFLLIRDLFGKLFQERYKERLVAFNREFKKYGYNYLLLLHVVMVVPLFVPNILAGLAHVSLWTFIWTTAVGIIPGALTFAFAGDQLMEIDSIHEIFSPQVLLAALLLLLFGMLPLFIRWYRAWRHKKGPSLEV